MPRCATCTGEKEMGVVKGKCDRAERHRRRALCDVFCGEMRLFSQHFTLSVASRDKTGNRMGRRHNVMYVHLLDILTISLLNRMLDHACGPAPQQLFVGVAVRPHRDQPPDQAPRRRHGL